MKPRVLSAELVHYVDFYVDGNKRRSDQVEPQPVKSRSLKQLQIPDDAFAFHFIDTLAVTVRLGRRTFRLEEHLNESRTYHVGRVYTLATIKRRFPRAPSEVTGRTITQLLEERHLRRAVRSNTGHWYPLDDDDVVIPHPKQT